MPQNQTRGAHRARQKPPPPSGLLEQIGAPKPPTVLFLMAELVGGGSVTFVVRLQKRQFAQRCQMHIRLSIAARDKNFSRAMRRLRPIVETSLEKVRRCDLEHPTWSEVLIGITDEYSESHIETVPNTNDMLQMLVGFPSDIALVPANDREILAAILRQIQAVVRECGLTPADEKTVAAILNATDATWRMGIKTERRE